MLEEAPQSPADEQLEGGRADPPQEFRVKDPSVPPVGGGAAHSKSGALTIAGNEGMWRARYFAIEAARLQEEHQNGDLILRYFPSLLIAADRMTKKGSAIIVEKFRQCMNARLPTIPEDTMTIQDTDHT